MKILNSLSNFIWLFIVVGLVLVKVFIFPSESTPQEPFSFGRFTYGVGEFVISAFITITFTIIVYKTYIWIDNRKRMSKSK